MIFVSHALRVTIDGLGTLENTVKEED